jgi:nucleoside-diphosphate-sugar epimerase
VGDYRSVYEEGTCRVLEWLREHPCRRYAYTSSTSVYGQVDGSEVTEDSPTEPTAETAKVLLATEQLLRDAVGSAFESAGIFRAAGIYGPGRGYLYRQFLRGDARIEGDGRRWLNMIHRDDLAEALAMHLVGTGSAPPSNPGGGFRVFNAADVEPVTQFDFFEWLSRRLGRPLPPRIPPDSVVARKRGGTNKRVNSQRLQTELCWRPHYPTFREGYESLIEEGAT